ncbi:hypothetical protein V6N13_117330 [Hibiscus sabdariffa]
MTTRLAILLLVLSSILVLHECSRDNVIAKEFTMRVAEKKQSEKQIVSTCQLIICGPEDHGWYCPSYQTGCYQNIQECNDFCPPWPPSTDARPVKAP